MEDEPLRRSLAEASPRVLRSLPNDTRMNDLYRRTIRAAAESAPFFPASPGIRLVHSGHSAYNPQDRRPRGDGTPEAAPFPKHTRMGRDADGSSPAGTRIVEANR